MNLWSDLTSSAPDGQSFKTHCRTIKLNFLVLINFKKLDKRKIVRETLKETRLQHGLRQQDVALALGRPQSYVAKIESGERKADFVEVLELCTAVGLNPKALLKRLS